MKTQNRTYNRSDMAHLKWSMINQRGLSPKQARERIRELAIAEKRDREFNEKILKEKSNVKPDFREEFRKLKHDKR